MADQDDLDEFFSLVGDAPETRIWVCQKRRHNGTITCKWLLTNDPDLPRGYHCDECGGRTIKCICRPEHMRASCVDNSAIPCLRRKHRE